MIAEAVSHYLDYDAWFVGEVEKGQADLRAGRSQDFDEAATALRAKMASRLAETRD